MLRFLLIDDSSRFRRYFKKAVAHKWPDARLHGHDPHQDGKPDADFAWGDYDLIFLDYELGLQAENGLDWLQMIKAARPDATVLIVTGMGDEQLAVQAIKCGADGYIVKQDVVGRRLYEQVTEALAHRAVVQSLAESLPADAPTVRRGTAALPAASGERTARPPDRWRIPGYACLRELAGRSWSATFLAERQADGRQVVVKALDVRQVALPVLVKRFVREFTVLSHLKHPNIVRPMDYGFTQYYAYYSMEYMPAGDLAEKIKGGRLPLESALACVRSLAAGLDALHALQVVHRDVKPNNVLFKQDGEPVIADLGIAKDLSCSDSMTAQGKVLGTPFYMSPEQIDGGRVDRRADIYSLGVVFYELLTGGRPFTGDSIIEVACQHAYDAPPPLPAALAAFQPVIDKLLAKSPAERYQDMTEFIAALADGAPG